MRLVDDWRRILLRAHSVRFQLFNAFCVGMGSGIFGLTMEWAPLWVAAFVAACIGFQLAPIFARIVWQPDFRPSSEDG